MHPFTPTPTTSTPLLSSAFIPSTSSSTAAPPWPCRSQSPALSAASSASPPPSPRNRGSPYARSVSSSSSHLRSSSNTASPSSSNTNPSSFHSSTYWKHHGYEQQPQQPTPRSSYHGSINSSSKSNSNIRAGYYDPYAYGIGDRKERREKCVPCRGYGRFACGVCHTKVREERRGESICGVRGCEAGWVECSACHGLKWM